MTVNIGQWENRINARNKVGLELVEIDVQGTIETERSSNRRDNLGNKSVKVCEAWRSDTETVLADIINSFIINLFQ